MTQMRWILAGALTLGLSGTAWSQQSAQTTAPASRTQSVTCPTTCPAATSGSCPTCCQDCPAASSAKSGCTSPCCAVWQFVLRLGGVGISTEPTAAIRPSWDACAVRLISESPKSCPAAGTAYGCCDEHGQCNPEFNYQEIYHVQMQDSGTVACPATCSAACAGSCPTTCTTGTCPQVCDSGCATTAAVQAGKGVRFVIIGGTTVQRYETQLATPMPRAVPVSRNTMPPLPPIPATPRQQGPLQISVKGKQLQILTPTMNATCDQITSLPTGPFHVLMEGNVKVSYHEPHSPAKIEAKRILVDLSSSEFKIPQDSRSIMPVHQVGLWYAPSPVPMMYPPAPPVSSIGYPLPMPHPMPVGKPINLTIPPAVYYPSINLKTSPKSSW